MNDSSTVRRKLLMHPPHQTLGLSGTGTLFHPYCPIDGPPADDTATEAMRVRLVSRPSDAGASAALAAFESIVRRQLDVECERVDFNPFAAVGGRCQNVDCMVLFSRGLHVVGRGADFDAETLAEDSSRVFDGPSTEVEISAVVPRHPLLNRVGTFVARPISLRSGDVPEAATCLLVGNTPDGVYPVAWFRDFPVRVFRTMLGTTEDFRRPDFVRLVLNAIEWAGS